MTIAVVDSTWIANGQELFVTTAGYFLSNGKPDGTHVTLFNQGYLGNVAPGTVITNPQQVGPAGTRGQDGVAVGVTLNSISPTMNRGDLIVDNGALSPAANDVRLGVGSDGKALVADSSQPTGLHYSTITPNSVASDNNIPRYDGTTGTPMPLQDSKLLITDDGAIQSTPTGGNARGSKAVDLQVTRTVPTAVASGGSSVVGGGSDNTASADYSTVSGGNLNLASAAKSTVAGGYSNSAIAVAATVVGGNGNGAIGVNAVVSGGNSNSASGLNATISGGNANSAANTNATVIGGNNNTASGFSATVVGGNGNTASGTNSTAFGIQSKADKYGQLAHAGGQFASAGDAQRSRLLARNSTTDATPALLFLDGAAARLTVPINTAWAFTGTVLGRTSAGVCGFYAISGGIKNNASVTSLIGAVTVAATVADGGWPGGASVTITADVINNALSVSCIGAGATSIRWLCNLDITEVGF